MAWSGTCLLPHSIPGAWKLLISPAPALLQSINLQAWKNNFPSSNVDNDCPKPDNAADFMITFIRSVKIPARMASFRAFGERNLINCDKDCRMTSSNLRFSYKACKLQEVSLFPTC